MFYTLAIIISKLANILEWLIIIRVLISWLSPNRFNPLIVQLYKITDPILRPFQDLVPSYKLGIDLSPIFALFAIRVAAQLLITLLRVLFV